MTPFPWDLTASLARNLPCLHSPRTHEFQRDLTPCLLLTDKAEGIDR